MFILDPDQYLKPCFRISPFTTLDIGFNTKLPASELIDDYLFDRFPTRDFHYTSNGRSALNLSLATLKLHHEDVVTILTTSGNKYISSCVTDEINQFCRWSRKMENRTKAIVVNHEFGYPFENVSELMKYGVPVIEDCAHSFFSTDKKKCIGNTGDFVIYSFPKMFPLQTGGLLLFNKAAGLQGIRKIEGNRLKYIKTVLSMYIDSEREIKAKRLYNYNYLKNKFESLGLSERFRTDVNSVPGVFMFKTENLHLNLPDLKLYFYAHGVQCSVFYGEEAFFIPVHQALGEADMDYFYEIMKSFINRSSK